MNIRYTQFILGFLLFSASTAWAQEQRYQQLQEELLKTNYTRLSDFPVENIGPSVMGGRIVDIAVNPTNSSTFVDHQLRRLESGFVHTSEMVHPHLQSSINVDLPSARNAFVQKLTK